MKVEPAVGFGIAGPISWFIFRYSYFLFPLGKGYLRRFLLRGVFDFEEGGGHEVE